MTFTNTVTVRASVWRHPGVFCLFSVELGASPRCVFVIVEEAAAAAHCYQQATIHSLPKFISGCDVFGGFSQMCDGVYLPLQYHIEFQGPNDPLSSASFSPFSPNQNHYFFFYFLYSLVFSTISYTVQRFQIAFFP